MQIGESLRKSEWCVAPIGQSAAAELVKRFHYAGRGSNTGVYRHGLFRKGEELMEFNCIGVAWWIPPTKSAALATYPDNWQGVLCLSRLVLDPLVPKNGASFLMSASMRLIDRVKWPCLVTYADTLQGHTGAIYRATNWDYVGVTKPERAYFIDGIMVSRKRGPRTFTHQEMLDQGAECKLSEGKHKFTHLFRKTKRAAGVLVI
jgi:hypothetical protein